MGRILNLLYRGGEGKESSGAWEPVSKAEGRRADRGKREGRVGVEQVVYG